MYIMPKLKLYLGLGVYMLYDLRIAIYCSGINHKNPHTKHPFIALALRI